MTKSNEFMDRAVSNADLASKTQVTGFHLMYKHVGLAIAWAVLVIADTLRTKTTTMSLEGLKEVETIEVPSDPEGAKKQYEGDDEGEPE